MKELIIWLGILVVVAVGGYFLYKTVPPKKAEAPVVATSVRIGVIAGTTGQYASAGEGYLKGFELAREEWNKTKSPKFTDVVEDDGFDSKKGMSAYIKLKTIDKTDAYAILSTFTIDVIGDDIVRDNKPTALGFEQSATSTDDSIVQVLPAARPIQKGLGEHLKSLGYKKPLAIVSDNTPVYENFFSGFIEGYGTGVLKEKTNGDATLSRALATKIIGEKPDVVVFFTAPKDGALIVKELIRLSKNKLPKMAFDQSIQSGASDYKEILGGSFKDIDGSVVALSRNDLSQTFKDAYKAKYGVDAPFASDMGYNSFTLLAETYDSDQAKWVQNIKVAKFTGADGDVSFDSVGLRIPNIYFGELKDGEVVVK